MCGRSTPRHPPIIGKAAAADYSAKNPSPPGSKLNWTAAEAETSAAGDLGYTRGTWVGRGKKKDASAYRLAGYYVTGWKKQASGSHKFMLDIGGADEPSK